MNVSVPETTMKHSLATCIPVSRFTARRRDGAGGTKARPALLFQPVPLRRSPVAGATGRAWGSIYRCFPPVICRRRYRINRPNPLRFRIRPSCRSKSLRAICSASRWSTVKAKVSTVPGSESCVNCHSIVARPDDPAGRIPLNRSLIGEAGCPVGEGRQPSL